MSFASCRSYLTIWQSDWRADSRSFDRASIPARWTWMIWRSYNIINIKNILVTFNVDVKNEWEPFECQFIFVMLLFYMLLSNVQQRVKVFWIQSQLIFFLNLVFNDVNSKSRIKSPRINLSKTQIELSNEPGVTSARGPSWVRGWTAAPSSTWRRARAPASRGRSSSVSWTTNLKTKYKRLRDCTVKVPIINT